MKNAEAFVYCWTDHLSNKIYVGKHKGHQQDGYVCREDVGKTPREIGYDG